jgi:hypothetical protein
VVIRQAKEKLSTEVTKAPRSCLVRSGTNDPCRRPSAVKIGGVLFCEPCAREQEAYFAVGELTEDPRSPHDDERLAGLLGRMRRTEPERRMIRPTNPMPPKMIVRTLQY